MPAKATPGGYFGDNNELGQTPCVMFRQMHSELEALIKMEIGGRLTHLETRLEQKIDARLDAIDADYSIGPNLRLGPLL